MAKRPDSLEEFQRKQRSKGVAPGMNWHDLQAAAPIDQLLADVRDSKPTEVAVVVRRGFGYVEVWGSHPNGDAVIGLLMRGVNWLAAREQLREQDP